MRRFVLKESHLTLEFKSHYVIKPSVWGENNKNYNKDNKGETGKMLRINLNIHLCQTLTY